MKARLLALAALMLWGASAFAQEDDPFSKTFRQKFSVEIGIGPAPFHMALVSPGWEYEEALAEEGKKITATDRMYPAFSLSGVWHPIAHWEYVLTASASWRPYQITRYEEFGIDPQGKPRYDLTKEIPEGKRYYPGVALFFEARVYWNPAWRVKMYSAFGSGLFTDGSRLTPVPSLTPVALRINTGSLYFFVEDTLSPAATLLHLGLGWTF
jgi:hypothetical protein